MPGSYGVAKEALAEIASRFRARYLRDTKPGIEVVPRGGRYEPFKVKFKIRKWEFINLITKYLFMFL